jgi:hypothetical protein
VAAAGFREPCNKQAVMLVGRTASFSSPQTSSGWFVPVRSEDGQGVVVYILLISIFNFN